eukprot:858312-Rhodomonas_salina.2
MTGADGVPPPVPKVDLTQHNPKGVFQKVRLHSFILISPLCLVLSGCSPSFPVRKKKISFLTALLPHRTSLASTSPYLSQCTNWQLEEHEFKMEKKIGEGAYGMVYRCTVRGEVCAAKMLKQNLVDFRRTASSDAPKPKFSKVCCTQTEQNERECERGSEAVVH